MTPESLPKLLRLLFPELDAVEPDPLGSLAMLTDQAHQTGNGDFLNRSYTFIRWAVRNIGDEPSEMQIAWFFDLILQFEHSKAGCLEFLDWEDVELLTGTFTVEPSFSDTDNFEQLCREWKKRRERNQKLPPPRLDINP